MLKWHVVRLNGYDYTLFLCVILNISCLLVSLPPSVPLAMPVDLEVTPSSYSSLRVSWGAAPGATQYMILYSALNHGEPDDAKEVKLGFSSSADKPWAIVKALCTMESLSATSADIVYIDFLRQWVQTFFTVLRYFNF